MQPFAKWLGGKRKLAETIISTFPNEFNTYYEPFVGAGAVYLALSTPKNVISDVNSDLICVYQVLLRGGKELELLCQKLQEYADNHSEDFYYITRALDREESYSSSSQVDKAARMLYLNKAGFNGLFRQNAKGYFNVPSGKRTNLTFDIKNLREISSFMKSSQTTVCNNPYQVSLSSAKEGDVVYLDPPYDSESQAAFTSYAAGGFNRVHQQELYYYALDLVRRGVFVVSSNASTNFVRELWTKDDAFEIRFLDVARAVGARYNAPSKTKEVLILPR